MPLQATSGAASYDAFGGGVPVVPTYIEDVMSTWLYTGTGATQTITNGIDLSTKGGLTWIKRRNGANNNVLFDTSRGAGNVIASDSTTAQFSDSVSLTAFNTTGFALGDDSANGNVNFSGSTYVSWTFRKAPKFFDVVTWVGTGGVRTLTHNLGSTPGSIFVKKIVGAPQSWAVYHRSLGATQGLALDLPNVAQTWSGYWNNTEPTSTQFTVGGGFNAVDVDYPGTAYVAYIFAHDAGGFGLTGTDNVISCGSFTQGAGATTVNLGYEPQFLITKRSNSAGAWQMWDIMRGQSNSDTSVLLANASSAEVNYSTAYMAPNATGFTSTWYGSGNEVIYIAIRRGPMKVPTDATKVFIPIAYNGNSVLNRLLTTGFTTDVIWRTERFKTSGVAPAYNGNMSDRLSNGMLRTNLTDADDPTQAPVVWGSNVGVIYPTDNYINNATGSSYILYGWQRAPGFFDEVCYTGNGSARTISHNLGVAPELMIVKVRSTTNDWAVYSSAIANTEFLLLDTTSAKQTNVNFWNSTSPTSSVFTVGTRGEVNASGQTFVAYLFATCAGVSKVGSYTGNGSSQTINCGFTGGARFVLIKKTSGTGDWMVADSARGIVSGNDPYLELNNTNAEVTGEDWLDTDSTGFVVNEVSGSNANTNGATYIFLAIA
jgi:hypothetical protein